MLLACITLLGRDLIVGFLDSDALLRLSQRCRLLASATLTMMDVSTLLDLLLSPSLLLIQWNEAADLQDLHFFIVVVILMVVLIVLLR